MNDFSSNPLDADLSLLRMWSDFATKMMTAGMPSSPESTPPEAAREYRTAMLKNWGDSVQQMLRSPAFLEMMKQSFDTSVQARKQFNDFLGQVHHEFQGVSRQDLDQLMRALRHVEQRSVDSLERIADRLEEVVRRLEAVEKRLPPRENRQATP